MVGREADEALMYVGVAAWMLCAYAAPSGAVVALGWYAVMETRQNSPFLKKKVFHGRERGDVAFVGAAAVLMVAILTGNSVVAGTGLAAITFFSSLDDMLVWPEEAFLRKQLQQDMVDQTVEVEDLTNPNYVQATRPRRLKGFQEKLQETHPECDESVNTIAAVVDRSRLLFADNQLSATRILHPDGSLGEYNAITYGQFLEMVFAIEDNLHVDRVGIYAKNCEDVAAVIFAALHSGVLVVPLYDTLGPDAVRHIVNHAQLTMVVTSEENLELVIRLKSSPSVEDDTPGTTNRTCEELSKVYVMKDRTKLESSVNRGPRSVLGLDILPFEKLLEKSSGDDTTTARKPVTPGDLAFILYTSGTTGQPKGVQLTHRSIIASASALVTTVVVNESDVHLSYLPLAHSFEIAVIVAGMLRGASVGWYHGNVKELTDDAKILRPTMFIGVPRVFQRVQQVVLQQFALKPAPIRRLCYHAVRQQLLHTRKNGGNRLKIYDVLVFRQVRAALGGRVRLMCTGSAPLKPSIQEFIKVSFDVPLVEGFGMTECSGVSHAMLGGLKGQFDPTVGHVGPPLACSEYKLESVPDLGYTVEDKPYPRGEVLIRGPNIFTGYYKDPTQTKQALSSNGWLHTGDIGRINANGTLSIIDRKKEMFKLAQGEFVVPATVEGAIMSIPEVGQVFIYGSSDLPHLVALIVPDPLELIPAMRRESIVPASLLPALSPDLGSWIPQYLELIGMESKHREKIKQHLTRKIAATCKEYELPKFMHPRDIFIVTELNNLLQGFSVENGMLTPTFKLKRAEIARQYKALLTALLQGSELPAPEGVYKSTSILN